MFGALSRAPSLKYDWVSNYIKAHKLALCLWWLVSYILLNDFLNKTHIKTLILPPAQITYRGCHFAK
jgi:hypothetical protein